MVDYFGSGDKTVGRRVALSSGGSAYVPAFMAVDNDGNPSAGQTYRLANNEAIGATSGTAPVVGVQRGTYILDVQFTGTSVQFQSLGADGVTWRNIGAALVASGSTSVALGQGSTVRLYNPNATGLTAVSATLT